MKGNECAWWAKLSRLIDKHIEEDNRRIADEESRRSEEVVPLLNGNPEERDEAL